MKNKLGWLVIGIMWASAAVAYDGPKADYSADIYLESSDGISKGKVYASKNKERREMTEDGEKMTLIFRRDKQLVWMLMTEDKMYMEMKAGKQSDRKDDITDWKIEQTTVGPETLDGIKTTKSKIIMTSPKGEKMGGFWWMTKDDILVKVDVIAVEKKSKERFKTELKNLKVAKQDPKLFEIPAGYTKMSMGMGLGGSKSGDGKNDDEGSGFGLKDALDLFK